MGLARRYPMSDHRRTMRPTQAFGVSLVVLPAIVAAQVPANKEPHHRTVYENADLRVLDVRLGPGESAADHRHDSGRGRSGAES